MSKTKIKSIKARQITGSLGKLAIEVDVTLRFNAQGRVSASLSSIANLVADELLNAITLINTGLHKKLKGQNVQDPSEIDQVLLEFLVSHPNCRPLRSIIRAVSMAILYALADTEKIPLWQYIGIFMGKSSSNTLPLPIFELLSKSGPNTETLNAQSFSIIPMGATDFSDGISWCQNVRVKMLELVSDESVLNDTHALDILTRSIGLAGFQPGIDVGIALNIKASSFHSNGMYHLTNEIPPLTRDELSGRLVDWLEKFPIISIEAPFSDDDLEGFSRFTWAVGKRVQIITNHNDKAALDVFKKITDQKAGNALNLKIDCTATLSTALALLDAAKANRFSGVISSDTGILDQTLPIHLAVGCGINQIKFRTFIHAQSISNWNEGIRIAEDIFEGNGKTGSISGALPPSNTFPWA